MHKLTEGALRDSAGERPRFARVSWGDDDTFSIRKR